ncbi:MAG: PA0069 family radical SAM protein, partial [Saprospiraceae bacterium]|nr:PA0069 family radical SAM protein [Saprospiraceae bacterium]
DIPFGYSINPYQGCEHGCVYCYARNTHPYWGYSAGQEFEQKILYKDSAPQLLKKWLSRKSWKAHPIMLSGNTDCYQPLEKRMKITRKLLETFYQFRHPVGIITKNSLIQRDLDILEKLASQKLVSVCISVTTLNEELRMIMEPRTATAGKKMEVIRQLSQAGVPVHVLMGPVIPGINDHEIMAIGEQVSDAGALGFHHTFVRLNADVGIIFEDWIRKAMPDRADKVLNKIRDSHGGKLGSSVWGKRMSGQGNISQMISDQVKLVQRKYFSNKSLPEFNCDLHAHYKTGQLDLFQSPD